MRYRFLRTKRYPHPDGPKRAVGSVYPVDLITAAAWVRVGILEPEAPPALDPPTSVRKAGRKAR